MDAFSASLMADKREIIFAPTVYKFQTFAQMAEEFKLGERDVVLTNEFIYTPFMKDLGLKCQFVFQEKFGAGETSEAMNQAFRLDVDTCQADVHLNWVDLLAYLGTRYGGDFSQYKPEHMTPVAEKLKNGETTIEELTKDLKYYPY